MGVTNERWFLPKSAESRQGADLLTAVRNDNAAIPIYVIVTASDGEPILAKAHIAGLVAYAGKLTHDERVATVQSPVTLRAGLHTADYEALYADADQALKAHPEVAEYFLSRDRRAALFQITPANGLAVKNIEKLTRDIAALAPAGPFTVMVGGTPAAHNDFNDYMFKSLPRIFSFVVGATLLLLFVAFRSYLLPIKAVITNLFAVAAGIGRRGGGLSVRVVERFDRPGTTVHGHSLGSAHDGVLLEFRAVNGLRAVSSFSYQTRA